MSGENTADQFSMHWTYQNGMATAVRIQVGAGVAMEARLSGVTQREAERGTPNLRTEFNRSSWDNTLEPRVARAYNVLGERPGSFNQAEMAIKSMEDALRSAGVSGRVDYLAVTGPTGNIHSVGVARMEVVSDGRNGLMMASPSMQGRNLYVQLAGLNQEEARQVEGYFANNPRERERFMNLYENVAADGKITLAERSLVNNDAEQLMLRSGVKADVSNMFIMPKI